MTAGGARGAVADQSARRQCASGPVATAGHERGELRADLVANAPERSQARLPVAFDGGRVLEAPVDALGRVGENRAALPRVVTDGDDVVESPARELVDRFRAVAGDVDSELLHRLDRLGTDVARARPRARDLERGAAVVAQQPLGHLAAGRVARAENENTGAIRHRSSPRPRAAR